MTTHQTHPHELGGPAEHSTASLGAVVVAGVVLLGFVVGAAVLVARLVDVLSWATGG